MKKLNLNYEGVYIKYLQIVISSPSHSVIPRHALSYNYSQPFACHFESLSVIPNEVRNLSFPFGINSARNLFFNK